MLPLPPMVHLPFFSSSSSCKADTAAYPLPQYRRRSSIRFPKASDNVFYQPSFTWRFSFALNCSWGYYKHRSASADEKATGCKLKKNHKKKRKQRLRQIQSWFSCKKAPKTQKSNIAIIPDIAASVLVFAIFGHHFCFISSSVISRKDFQNLPWRDGL